MLERPRTQPYVQVLVALIAVIMMVAVTVIDPAALTPLFGVAVVVTCVGAVVMTVFWRLQPTTGTAWLAVIPLIDILTVIPMRDAAYGILPAVGIIVIFPVGWLAFAFGPGVTAIGVIFTALVPLPSVLRGGFELNSPGNWVQFLALPVTMAFYAITIRIISRDLLTQRVRARHMSDELARLLQVSGRDGAALQTLFEATDDAVCIFDSRGRTLMLNSEGRKVMDAAGITALSDPGRGAGIREADGSTPIPTGPELVERVRRGELAAPRILHIGAPGQERIVRTIMRPIGSDKFGLIAVSQDITDLVRAVEVRDRFLGTVGHEFRTPITVILGQADLALMADPPDRTRWEAVERAGERLIELVERLIAVGQETVQTQGGVTPVISAAQYAVAELAEQASAHGIRFTVEGDYSLSVKMGPKDLKAILVELARNAMKFSHQGGDVVIRAHRKGDSAVIDVVDGGIGMTVGERAQAFDRFYRAPHAHKSVIPGAGLGLPLVAALARAHGATIALAPAMPQGTRATLTVPAD